MRNDKVLPTHTSTPDGLATVTQLGRMRRQLAPRQKPVAQLLYHGNKHCPLYRIDAADLMPPMTGRQRTAAVAREAEHVCSRCGRYEANPLPAGPRTCRSCIRITRILTMLDRRPDVRAAEVDWARKVLADPGGLVVAVRTVAVKQPVDSWIVKREAVVNVAILPMSGEGEAEYLLAPQENPVRKRDIAEGARSVAEVAEEITERFVGARPIIAWAEHYARVLATDLRDAITGYGKQPPGNSPWSAQNAYQRPLYLWERDTLLHHYSEWVGEINPNTDAHSFVRQRLAYNQPIDQVHWMLRTLQRMARGGTGA